MGIKFGNIIQKKSVELKDFKEKSFAIDAYNVLYQFLSIIRGFDGKPLIDRNGKITSHLSGLFYRTSKLLEYGIKPVYVFDGKPPFLKLQEIERRSEVKKNALIKYEQAIKEKKYEKARVYAQATSKIEGYMVDDSKRLLSLMGIPWVQSPSEGEAQASFMASKGDVWAVSSQDYDSLLFGSPRLVRNITISGRRKLSGRKAYIEVKPEIIDLYKVLEELEINREQLIIIGMLIGTDYNVGLDGIGPKKALSLVKKFKNIEDLEKNLNLNQKFNVDPKALFKIFIEPDVTDKYNLTWSKLKKDEIIDFLCNEKNFSKERIKNILEKILSLSEIEKLGLKRWF